MSDCTYRQRNDCQTGERNAHPVTDSKTGSVLTFAGNRYISNDARNNTLSGTYHVLQNGKRTPMHEMTREQVEQTVAEDALPLA